MKEAPVFIYITVTATGKRKRWEVVWRDKGHPDLDDAVGRIDGPFVKGKRIYLQRGQTMEGVFDTLLHEMVHGAGWHLAEDWVHSFANDVTKAIKKLGFEFKAVKE